MTFIPISLLIQYKNVVVGFYTINGFLQMIPSITTNSPMASLVPVIFIVLVGMMKELYLELKRYREDKKVN